MRRAVIDIGTNSVKLLVAEVDGETVCPLFEQSTQTRLGEGFYEEHRLQEKAIGKTAEAVARFALEAAQWRVSGVRVVATSAARDAINQGELLAAVRLSSGLEVAVISGEQEADWVFAGVRSDPALHSGALLIVDVGGGSSEFILGKGAIQLFRGSFPLGTVRLLEQIRPEDPPRAQDWERCQAWLERFLQGQVAPVLHARVKAVGPAPALLVGTGGTITILAAMESGSSVFDREQFEKVLLSRATVWKYQKRLWSLSLAERQSIVGLPANRADVILFGVATFALIMETFGFEQIRVSTRGLRFAAALSEPGLNSERGRSPAADVRET